MPGADYPALHRRSVDDPGWFWDAVWDFCGIAGEKGPAAFEAGEGIGSARFFPGGKVSYAENLLRGPPERVCLLAAAEGGGVTEWTLGRLRETVARVARGLRGIGVGRGDVVAGIVANAPEAVAAMLAAQSLGAAWTSCSPDFGAPALRDRLGQAGPKAVFATAGYRYGGKDFDVRPRLAELSREIGGVRACVVHPFAGFGAKADGDWDFVEWDAFAAGEDPGGPEFERTGLGEPGFILYSSGTTGMPKCIVHSAGGMLLKHACELALHCDVREGDSLLYLTTCGWMMWNWQVSALALGATLMLCDGSPVHPDASALPDLAWERGVTHFGASAKYFSACSKAGVAPASRHGREGPRTILSTGSPLLPDGFDYLYREWGKDVHVASISGGTDICACFVGGVPTLPVLRGRIQAAELGCDVAAFGEGGRPVTGEPGELVCRSAIPSMPLGFRNDPDGSRYRAAYFEKNPGVWSHGDWVTVYDDGSMVISGRSDATLNPGGVRIGTAEIYRQVESLDEVLEAVAVGRDAGGDQQVLLFVRLAEGAVLDEALEGRMREAIRTGASPRHVPALIAAVGDIPRTRSGKVAELAVRDAVCGREAANAGALANPEALDAFRGYAVAQERR